MSHIHKNETCETAIIWDNTKADRETLVHAMEAFGHLLSRCETLPLRDFAKRIKEHYAASPRIDAICYELNRA